MSNWAYEAAEDAIAKAIEWGATAGELHRLVDACAEEWEYEQRLIERARAEGSGAK